MRIQKCFDLNVFVGRAISNRDGSISHFYGQKCAPFYNLSGSGKSVSIYENGYGPLWGKLFKNSTFAQSTN